MTAKKKLILSSIPNFRDLGGMAATDGRILRYGAIYRSEGPRHLTEGDAELLRRVNFRTIFDLRGEKERLSASNYWCNDSRAKIVNLNIASDLPSLRAAAENASRTFFDEESAEIFRDAITRIYRKSAKTMIPYLRMVFDEIIDNDALPVLIHCTSGKDRTGFITALLLSALDIGRATVEADYLQSSQCVSDTFYTWLGGLFIHYFGSRPHRNILKELLGVRSEYLNAALTSIDDLAGSVDNYLREHVGLSNARRRILREKLLVTQ
jgi:protein-tyrosine phosphatase